MGTFSALIGIFIQLVKCISDKVQPGGNEEVFIKKMAYRKMRLLLF